MIRGRAGYVLHNVIAHPLLVLWPRFGMWLHERTDPTDESEEL